MHTIADLGDLQGKRVLVRSDLNVPLEKDSAGKAVISDDGRIRASVPTIKALSEALNKMAALPQYTSFLDKQSALKNSYVPGQNAALFMQGELDEMKKIVDSLPFHARYLFSEAEFERYVEPF